MCHTENSPSAGTDLSHVRRTRADAGQHDYGQTSPGAIAERALRETGRSALREVVVDSYWQVVILRGRVQSYYEKQLAQAVVQQVSANHQVVNEIEVVCCR